MKKIKIDLFKYIQEGKKQLFFCIDDRNVVRRIITYLELQDDIIFLLMKIISLRIELIFIDKYIYGGFYL
ncbi:MAG: hypothetical protein L6V91_01465 [Bacilli bacterium]|nr:MAG: hypothetical protein L6V91_01465 [Bacilli bacterium]